MVLRPIQPAGLPRAERLGDRRAICLPDHPQHPGGRVFTLREPFADDD